MATDNEQVHEEGLDSLQQTSSAAEDPMVNIYLMEDDGSRGSWSWQLERSCLTEHSGFFQAMFRNDFRETIENAVELHDDDVFHLDDIVACMQKGTWSLPDVSGKETIAADCAWRAHLTHLEHLRICDKYDMAEFKKQIFRSMSVLTPSTVREWRSKNLSESAFCAFIWGPVMRRNGGNFPEELYSAFAEAWVLCQGHNGKTPRMDAKVEADLRLAAGVAKACRDMAWRKSKEMERPTATATATGTAAYTEEANDEVARFMDADMASAATLDLDGVLSQLRLQE